ncbi:MAG: DMT family transporter [Rhodospirillaceae bacterium]|nr:DMT family transporter [Rhodospirillaceae bacterium]
MDRARLAYLAVFLGVCGHASSEFFAVLSGVRGPEVSVWRYTIGSIGLIAAALIWPKSRDLWTPLKAHFPRLLWLSVVGFTLAYLAFHWSLDFATAVQVGTLVTTIPIFVGVANLVINRVAFTTPKIVTGLAAVAGIALLLTDGYLFELAGREGSLTGIGLAVGCAALVAIYAVSAKPLINTYGAIRITTITMAMGTVGLWLLVGASWGIWIDPLSLFDREPQAAWSLLVLGLYNTTITQLLWLGGLAAVPDITRGSYLFFLKPVITAVLAYLFLTQPITWIQVAAIAVISGAVVLELLWPTLAARRAGSAGRPR